MMVAVLIVSQLIMVSDDGYLSDVKLGSTVVHFCFSAVQLKGQFRLMQS